MSYALVFSGQGTQHPDMLPWLESQAACQPDLRELNAVLGRPWREVLAAQELRERNALAQPLLVGSALAAQAALVAQLGTAPAAVAGYSVGELSAFACAGVLTNREAIALAVARAAAMDAAVAGQTTGLLSVSGMPRAAVLAACAELSCAIDIGEDQGIYAGTAAQLALAMTRLSVLGAVCKPLAVRVASHSAWMAPALGPFAASLDAVALQRPAMALALNATGSVSRQPTVLRDALCQQLVSTVQWAACMDAIAEQGVACVLEVGPGNALSRMWNQRHPHIPARALEAFQGLAGAVQWVLVNQ